MSRGLPLGGQPSPRLSVTPMHWQSRPITPAMSPHARLQAPITLTEQWKFEGGEGRGQKKTHKALKTVGDTTTEKLQHDCCSNDSPEHVSNIFLSMFCIIHVFVVNLRQLKENGFKKFQAKSKFKLQHRSTVTGMITWLIVTVEDCKLFVFVCSSLYCVLV